jgi:hypothetical protein
MAAELMWQYGIGNHSPGALTVQWRQWSRRDALDRLLIDGAPPDTSPELALRAVRLTREAHRRRVAAELEAVVAVADRNEPCRTALDVRVEHVRASRLFGSETPAVAAGFVVSALAVAAITSVIYPLRNV